MAFFRNVIARAAVLLIVLGIIGALSGCAKKEYACTDGASTYAYYQQEIETKNRLCLNDKFEGTGENRICFNKKTDCEIIN